MALATPIPVYRSGMKVLKKGREQKGWSVEVTCTGRGNGDGGCGAKLLVEQPDLFRTESHCRDETDVFTTFECPECKVWTDLKEFSVPSHVTSGLKLRVPRDR